jgi:hypothetical protein
MHANLFTHSKQIPSLKTGANPTIVGYNASAVKMYTASSSLLRSENKKYFFLLLKML